MVIPWFLGTGGRRGAKVLQPFSWPWPFAAAEQLWDRGMPGMPRRLHAPCDGGAPRSAAATASMLPGVPGDGGRCPQRTPVICWCSRRGVEKVLSSQGKAFLAKSEPCKCWCHVKTKELCHKSQVGGLFLLK